MGIVMEVRRIGKILKLLEKRMRCPDVRFYEAGHNHF